MSGKVSGVGSGSQPQSVGAARIGQPARDAGVAAGNAAGPGPAGTGASADSVAITGAASGLATAEQALATVPVVNQGRVVAIRGAIEAGTYRIQPQKIAARLLDMERDMPEPQADPAEPA